MPTLETTDGQSRDVTPVDKDAEDAKFDRVMNDDGPDDQAPPRRQRREPAADSDSKPRRGRQSQPKEEKSRTITKPVVTLDKDARSTGVKGLAQIVGAIAAICYKQTGNPAFAADVVTIEQNADEGVKVIVATAEADPRFAAAIDRLCSAGPYGALFMFGVSVSSQLVRNHKPSLALPGTVDPMELLTAPSELAAAAA